MQTCTRQNGPDKVVTFFFGIYGKALKFCPVFTEDPCPIFSKLPFGKYDQDEEGALIIPKDGIGRFISSHFEDDSLAVDVTVLNLYCVRGGAHGEKWGNSWTDRAKFPTKFFPIMILNFGIQVNY